MSDNSTSELVSCPSCGQSCTRGSLFCAACGDQFSRGRTAAPSLEETHVQTNLNGFRARLTATCHHCQYHGLMGWDDFHFRWPRAVWLPVAILLGLLGILPGLIVFLVVQQTKRYAATCPKCKKALLLKPNEAQPVKNAWGGAQFYDEHGQKIGNSKLLARAGKWVLVAGTALLGLFVVLGTSGLLIERVSHKTPMETEGHESALPNKQPVGAPSALRSNLLKAVSYAGRLPDAAFFQLPEINEPLKDHLPKDYFEWLISDTSRYVDFDNVDVHDQTLTLKWRPRILSGEDPEGGILLLNTAQGWALIAVREAEKPAITVYGHYDSVDPIKLPMTISLWLEHDMTEAVSHKVPKIVFDGSDRFAIAGISDPAALESFLVSLKAAVANNRKDIVASLITYPLLTTVGGQAQKVNSSGEFVAKYDQIVDSSVRQAVAEAVLGDLFANWKGIMIGNRLWLGVSEGNRLFLTQIYPK